MSTLSKVLNSKIFTPMSRTIKAAVVTEFGKSPAYLDFELPAPLESQVQVKVLAAGLHQLVKSRASGQHYSATTKLPMVAGVDGVGELPNGERVFFMAFDKDSTGTIAQYANILKNDCVPIPSGGDTNTIAALINPAMSSWMALRCRASCKPNSTVLIMGVTGTSGQLAVQIAKSLGASRVIGAGRNQKALDSLLGKGLDATITLSDDTEKTKQDFARTAANVDVVLDYLWGPPAELAIGSIIAARADKAHRLDWVQIGQMAGPTINFPASALRLSNFYVCGSGLGSVSPPQFRSELGELVKRLATGDFTADVDVRKFSYVEDVWTSKADNGRTVFVIE
ncbi:hypothetical protein VKS41_003274 [Umbelopsis sp. WA50703]|jgi:NADPH:quinone reductase-like Zn-dependent oxidoreductase